MTAAEELLAALKEHATADDDFAYYGSSLYVHRYEGVRVHVAKCQGQWCERINGETIPSVMHDSASAAVRSAFLRARE